VTELPQVDGGVDDCVVIGHLQSELDARPALEPLAHAAKRDLDFRGGGAGRGGGDNSDRRGELVADPVGQLIEQQPILGGRGSAVRDVVYQSVLQQH